MTKAELISSIAKETKISKASAEKAINAFTNSGRKSKPGKGYLTLDPKLKLDLNAKFHNTVCG